ncbi:malonyl-CoA decarboxylase family protein [Sulfitobacter sp. D35]|uniref:malonyl-CoA decarboxylase domain-containing protein n=1 Tax=Sulfitobacter sp. D35 TaxID=3083252 RepID=UPI00296E41E6|nr:malonyl-CoA decarboxylase family protein [Sulfitobacter sp. D35]MDW4496961.1 malonyl-CoA decarboxylase family protein [Sulfitobacter sp. D35]
MSVLGDILSTVLDRGVRSIPRIAARNSTTPELVRALLSGSGEISGMAIAQQIFDRYAEMDRPARLGFFRMLAIELDLDPAHVRETLDAYEATPGRETYRAYAKAAEPPRQELIRRLNQLPGGTARLVAMRRDLLGFTREHPDCAALDLDFRHLFGSWFNRGFLVLRPINWDTSAALLDKIIAYEAVHAIQNWDDLRRRLKPRDRRCFAFFHPSMPGEPLIFVEVALTRGVPGSIQALLAEDRADIAPEAADTAVFYSISNCQEGLAGISLGNSLIKQVASDLAVELPNLKTFVTLSPIPGLAAWMAETGLAKPVRGETLRQIAAHYLLDAKSAGGRPRDAVQRFHLGNGASVFRVHGDADTSEKGLAQSGGAMVNYLYDLDRITQNHEGFATAGTIAASAEVRNLASAGRSLASEKEDDEEPTL